MGTESGIADGGQHTRRCSSWWAATSPCRCCLFHCCPLLLSSIAVGRGLLFIIRHCPLFVHVCRALLRGFASLALRLAMGEVDSGGRTWFSWALVVVCGVLHPLCVLVAVVRRSWCCVGQLLSFLDSWDRLRGWGLSDVAWE